MNGVIYDRSQLVVKSNQLIQEGRFNLSVPQQRILLYMISKIKPTDTEFTPIEFSVIDFCELAGITEKTGYRTIKAAVKELADSSFWIESEGSEQLKRWISSEQPPEIVKGSGIIRLTFSNTMRQYLLELREKFTVYELEWVLMFRRKYSYRLYEYICSRHYDKSQPYTFRISFEELRAVLGAETYPQFKNFNQKVLSPAVAEINATTDKLVSVEFVKHGKKITDIDITVEEQPARTRVQHHTAIQRQLGYDPNQLDFFERRIYERED